MQEDSKTAWNIASKYNWCLASETRDLAAWIDQALLVQRESDAKEIAEKDIEIRSMIAVHNSDVDGMRLQEEKIADQKKVIEALSRIPLAVSAVLTKWQTTAYMTLHAGEMSAQEIRSVRAVLMAVRAEVMALLPPTDEQTTGKPDGPE
jgi:hypothetical protein